MKNNPEFQKFLKDEVNLNPNRLKRLKTGVSGVSKSLKQNLTGYQDIEPQGSYALETLIKPVADNDEYDADIQVVMDYNTDWEPKDYITAVHDALKADANYVDKLHRKTRCVTVDYAGEFHLDVVPRITVNRRGKENHYICNYRDNAFEPTDGTGYRDLFNEKNWITGGNLKRVVRLIKFKRDHKGNYTAKSIMFTTLAIMVIHPSDKGGEHVKSVADTLVTVLTRIDAYLQRHPSMPDIRNPVLPSENFNRHWDQRKYANFRNKIHIYSKIAREAKESEDKDDSVKLWRRLFGDDFGKGSFGGNGGGSKKSAKPGGGDSGNRARSLARRSPVVISTAELAKPYAGNQTKAQPPTARAEEVSIRVSEDDVEALRQAQPELEYDASRNRISGVLNIFARFNKRVGLRIEERPVTETRKGDINDKFSVAILLDYTRGIGNPWPIVIAQGWRIQRIMAKHRIDDIRDMHIYPGNETNFCCLGIDLMAHPPTNIVDFINTRVIPFFYRVAYVDRYGLQAARNDLWAEYSHEGGPQEYLRDILKTPRNQGCPCGSGRKFKRCCAPKFHAQLARN